MKIVRFLNFIVGTMTLLGSGYSLADQIFIRPTVFAGQNPAVAATVDRSIKEAITGEGKHMVISDSSNADYTIVSSLVEQRDSLELTVGKKKGGDLIYTRTLHLAPYAKVDANTKWLVKNAVASKPYNQRYQVGTLLSTQTVPPLARRKSSTHYYFSYGPAVSSGLENEQVMANLNVGGSLVSDQNILKLYYSHTGGTNEERKTNMSGLGFSAGRMVTHSSNPAFINADLVWGETSYNAAQPASVNTADAQKTKTKSGFIYGVGAGVLFSKGSKVNFESAVQINSFMGRTSSGIPSTVGFRVGIHF